MVYRTSAGSGVPNVGRARLHRHRAREAAEDDRRARSDQLREGHPGERLGERLSRDAGGGDRRHRAGEDERGEERGLVSLRVRPGGAQHRRVPDERGVRVDQRQDDRVVLEVLGTEQDPRHLHGIARPLRGRDGPHERLVRVAHVRVDHVEVPLVDGDVDRLAHRPATVVEMRRQVRELHEVPEVLDRAVTPALVEIADERGAVVRREDRVHRRRSRRRSRGSARTA